ncbi:hypothetical protein ABL78_2013 [Leptomonas seymouri]|uniref:RRM domain-containing protein n=1 Tax=Leptomonas seymouri TaxID=5684 RepID=A0A0N0P7L0_LEPSE|nr:hypothetical protein ABL78_2013 [Leptomonas seymouri]|eukprot:KPI88896.1 hypothetical protein ABL78_2013 [Leptomonas seymouri]
MPLNLVGKLHRTVYITNCPEDSQEDLMHMLLKRCGAVEAWDVADSRMTVVFQSVNSVSNALTFSGLSFVDLSSKICVWRATDPPPAEATQQLAIQGDGVSSNGGDTAVDQEEENRRLQRKERRAALQKMLQAEAKVCDTSTPEGRQAKLNELCLRQLKALCTLTAAALKDAAAELQETRSNLDRLHDLIRMKEAEGSAADEPPISRSRTER